MRRLGVCLLFVFGVISGVFAHAAVAEPPHSHTHEIIYTRPSGFWTSNQPAQGGAYRWRLLGIGCVVLAATGYLMWRVVKRASASRP